MYGKERHRITSGFISKLRGRIWGVSRKREKRFGNCTGKGKRGGTLSHIKEKKERGRCACSSPSERIRAGALAKKSGVHSSDIGKEKGKERRCCYCLCRRERKQTINGRNRAFFGGKTNCRPIKFIQKGGGKVARFIVSGGSEGLGKSGGVLKKKRGCAHSFLLMAKRREVTRVFHRGKEGGHRWILRPPIIGGQGEGTTREISQKKRTFRETTCPPKRRKGGNPRVSPEFVKEKEKGGERNITDHLFAMRGK